MTSSNQAIKATRRDIGNLVFHFTKRTDKHTAFEILKKIMKDGKILGANGFVKGGHKVVCFTEAPISEVASYFNAQQLINSGEKLRYEPYGIAFRKNHIFRENGRHVIYQPDNEYDQLPRSHQFRHVRYEPDKNIDYTWEREWRILADEFMFSSTECLIIVRTQEEANELIENHIEFEPDFDVEMDHEGEYVATPIGVNHTLSWRIVSMEMFGYEDL